ncbi:hypothetical protein SESBI_24479 [Sesbania bispinosa]|nr:hypothetical protein SESBI_24479 [Sesbania bispinosa]
MARTRKTYRLVDPGSSSRPNLQGGEDAEERKAWIDIKALEAHSLVSEHDVVAYFASLPETPCYDLIKSVMDERVSDHPRRNSEEDWFYIYDYCLTTLGVGMPFSNFQMRILSYLRICPTQFHPNGWVFARAYEIICNYYGIHASTTLFFHLFQVNRVDGKGDEVIALIGLYPCIKSSELPNVEAVGGSGTKHMGEEVVILDPPSTNIPQQEPQSKVKKQAPVGIQQDFLNKVVVSDTTPSTSEEAPRLERRTKQKRDSRAVSDPAGNDGQKQKQQQVELKVGALDSHTPTKTYVWGYHTSFKGGFIGSSYGESLIAFAQEVRRRQKRSLGQEKHSKDLAIRDRDEIKEKYEVTLAQVKGAEDRYLEAKEENNKMLKDLQSARTNLENTLKELKEAKKSKIDLEAKITASETTKSELDELREKYNDVLLNLGKDVYENTIQQLMILNPGLVVHGSAPHAYVDNSVIMVDTL